jgi:hypothetical protein
MDGAARPRCHHRRNVGTNVGNVSTDVGPTLQGGDAFVDTLFEWLYKVGVLKQVLWIGSNERLLCKIQAGL